MELSTLHPPQGATKKHKRIGRGIGSGHGKTSTRGHKGQYARSGAKRRFMKEGGQMPLVRRLPKRGFWNPFRVAYQVVNIAELDALSEVAVFDRETMLRLRLVRETTMPVKVLGTGNLSRAITVHADAFSKTAEEKIGAAGGRCEKVAMPDAAAKTA